jgi:hypothetical protein
MRQREQLVLVRQIGIDELRMPDLAVTIGGREKSEHDDAHKCK